MKVLTQNEVIRLLNRAKEEGCYELFLLELGTGMRRGEILALKWSDLNFTTGELRIERQVNVFNGEQIISEPKTKASIRTIILPPSLLQILSEYKETVDSEWIFPSPIDNSKTRHDFVNIIWHIFHKKLVFWLSTNIHSVNIGAEPVAWPEWLCNCV